MSKESESGNRTEVQLAQSEFGVRNFYTKASGTICFLHFQHPPLIPLLCMSMDVKPLRENLTIRTGLRERHTQHLLELLQYGERLQDSHGVKG